MCGVSIGPSTRHEVTAARAGLVSGDAGVEAVQDARVAGLGFLFRKLLERNLDGIPLAHRHAALQGLQFILKRVGFAGLGRWLAAWWVRCLRSSQGSPGTQDGGRPTIERQLLELLEQFLLQVLLLF